MLSQPEGCPKEIILPGTHEFEETLAHLPPDWRDVAWRSCGEYAHIVRPSSGGLIETVAREEAEEYYFSGEYDERLSQIPSDEEAKLFYDPVNDEFYGFTD